MTTTPAVPLPPADLPEFSLLLGHDTAFSGSVHFLLLSSMPFSTEARANSGMTRNVVVEALWHDDEFRSFENGKKAPPFLCLLSRASCSH